MAEGTPQHNQIGFNLITSVGIQMRASPCSGYTSDQRVLAGSLYTYPDVVIVCGEPLFEDEHRDTIINPTLIVEVLSSTMEAYDRGEKFACYRQIESLREYVLVSQNQPRVECFTRQLDGTWNYMAVEGLEATIHLASINCELKLAEIYDKVRFEAPPVAQEETPLPMP